MLTVIPMETVLAIGYDPVKTTKRVELVTVSGVEFVPLYSRGLFPDGVSLHGTPHRAAAGETGAQVKGQAYKKDPHASGSRTGRVGDEKRARRRMYPRENGYLLRSPPSFPIGISPLMAKAIT